MANSLELDTRAAAKWLHDHQKARLWKIPNDLRILADGFATFGEQTPCDFMGFTIIGRALLVECKELKKSSLPMNEKGLKAHQWIALQECHDAGGIGLLLWRHGQKTAVLDVDMIRCFIENRRSIPWAPIPKTHIGIAVESLLLPYVDPSVRRQTAKQ